MDPFWNFTNTTATAYWLAHVVGQLTGDGAMQGGRASVFFDETDQGQCGYHKSGCNFTLFNRTALQASSNAMLRQMVLALNLAGIVPILSLDNRMAASGVGLQGTLSRMRDFRNWTLYLHP